MHKEKYWHGKNVFITGINGFIGGNLAKSLIDKGANVFGLLRNQRKDIGNRIQFEVDYFNEI